LILSTLFSSLSACEKLSGAELVAQAGNVHENCYIIWTPQAWACKLFERHKSACEKFSGAELVAQARKVHENCYIIWTPNQAWACKLFERHKLEGLYELVVLTRDLSVLSCVKGQARKILVIYLDFSPLDVELGEPMFYKLWACNKSERESLEGVFQTQLLQELGSKLGFVNEVTEG